MKNNFKNFITNIAGLIMIIGGVVNAYFQSGGNVEKINWFQLGTSMVVAFVAYYTGKDPKPIKQ